MTDDYNLAKPDPNLRDNEVMMGAGLLDRGERIEEARQRVDASGFLAGEDRMKTAPELLEENKALRAELAETFRKLALSTQKLPPGRYIIEADGLIRADPITGETSDGYQTFRELYDHRRALTAALAKSLAKFAPWWVWRSRAHHPDDSPCYDGYFIVGISFPGHLKPITYHYADQFWDDFVTCETLPHAPKWHRAGPAETITRLLDYARG
jgi:hypothetical protein